MFTLDEILGAPMPYGGALGRRPFKELRNVLTTKPHRFRPPNIPELRVPADQAAIRQIDEVFEDTQTTLGERGLLAMRAVIQTPQVRAAGIPSRPGTRDYHLAAAVGSEGQAELFGVLSVSVSKSKHGTRLEGVRFRSVAAADIDAIRDELVAIYIEAEARQSLVGEHRPAVAWLRGNQALDTPPGWPAHLEGVAATYGLRLRVFREPDVKPVDAHQAISKLNPALAVVWDHDGRGTELEARVNLHVIGCPVERVYGDWSEVVLSAGGLFARRRNVVPPQSPTARSVAEAIAQAHTHPQVIILPAALQSAEACVFRRPADVRRALDVLVDAVSNGALTASGGLDLALVSAPFRYAPHVSATAHQRYADRYRRRYDGRDILLGPHLRLGAGSAEFCLRIYWYVDKDKQAIVIGHIGEHLPDAGS